MTNALKASVIILNWNGEKLLKEYLPSVIAHTNAELGKIVVVDNASTDNSVEVMNELFPDIELIRFDENYGYAGGYNKAVELADTEYVVLLNSDVEVGERWLEPLIDTMESQPEIAAVQPKIKAWLDKTKFEYAGACGGYIDSFGFPFCRGRVLDVTEEDKGQYNDIVEIFWCSGAAFCVRRDVYKKVGGLDERFFAHMEEIDLCWRLRNSGKKLKVIPSSVVYHLGGGSLPMNHPRKLFLNYRNNLLMLYKNLNRSQFRKVIFTRAFMDFAAMMVFFMKGQWANVKSVIKAYRAFSEMKHFYKSSVNGTMKDACILKGSIIFKYYFNHTRTFSGLWK